MKSCITLFLCLTVMSLFILSCDSIIDQKSDNIVSFSAGDMVGTYSEDACLIRCIDSDDPEYVEKTKTKTVHWGNPSNSFTKSVDIIYYNTLDHFILKLKSSHNIADVLVDNESIKNFNGTVQPDTWQEFSFELDEDWEACDTWTFELKVAGFGPPVYFDVEYQLVGECVEFVFECGISTVTDVDGNVYNTVLIGDQCWMAENLKVTRYNNETPITYPGEDNSAWENNTEGAYAWYNNDYDTYGSVYGALYNWHAVNNESNLCPTDWNVPSDEDWTTLVNYLGVSSVAGGKMKTTGTIEVGDGLWYEPNEGATNESGFSGLPGGFRNVSGEFANIGLWANWWSSTEHLDLHAWARWLIYNSSDVDRSNWNKQVGFSVRCFRDD